MHTMNQTRLPVSGVAHWTQKALPWAGVLALAMSLAYAMNVAVVGAFSATPPSPATPGAAGEAINPCTLDADGALYSRWDWWQPAGKTTFCRGQDYPGVAGRAEMAMQLGPAGRLLASITFVAPGDTRVDLYCATSTIQRSSDAEFVAPAETRDLYEQVCTPGSSD
jgi:hypothetical protein